MLSFKSKIAEKLLGYLFLHEEESFYINELVRLLDLDKRNLVKKLKEYEQNGLLISEMRGNQRYYTLNKRFPLYQEYKKIISKTVGLENELKNILKKIKKVKQAFIFGSYAQNKIDSLSDIDLLVIGDHNSILLQNRISDLQNKLNRVINVINISVKEFEQKKKRKNPFISEILKNKKINLR